MDLSSRPLDHGDRPGADRVPAGLVSSAHLIVVPQLLGWNDPFINSLAFDVMLHMGTLVALLVYFWRDWLRARARPGWRRSATGRSRATRIAGWPGSSSISMIPAPVLGALLKTSSTRPSASRPATRRRACWSSAPPSCGSPNAWGRTDRELDDLTFRDAWSSASPRRWPSFPGISRSGITISAGLFVGPEPRSGGPLQLPDGHARSSPAPASVEASRAAQRRAGVGGRRSGRSLVGYGRGARLPGCSPIAVLLRYLRDDTRDSSSSIGSSWPRCRRVRPERR